jgi:hypothetical protein
MRCSVRVITLTIFGPLVLSADLFLLLRSEIVGDVEGFTDLLWRLALDHVGHGFAANIKKWLDVEVVGGLYLHVSGAALYLIRQHVTRRREILTRMISKSISWSTCINFWSHSSISVVRLRASESSSCVWTGSPRWCSHHSMTLRRTDSLTLVEEISLQSHTGTLL